MSRVKLCCLLGCMILSRMALAKNPEPAVTLQKWEYLCLQMNAMESGHTKRLNELGQEGWELVTSFVTAPGIAQLSAQYCLKRPLEVQEPAKPAPK